jgi:L-alanine-DL-glutamate epimerase-like enolase superfamily enzyme
MKISFQQLDLHLAQPWSSRAGRTEVSKLVVLELIGNDGIISRGEAAPISRYKEEALKNIELANDKGIEFVE